MEQDVGVVGEVLEKLAERQALARVVELIAAAMSDDLELTLAGQALPDSRLDRGGGDSHDSGGAYVGTISVAGFRGVGPEVDLDLTPGPGLTLVVGRNGSGKSSFAEAAEYALTGQSSRWVNRSVVVRNGWRNLHQPESAVVRLGLLFEHDPEQLTVERTWKTGADLDDHDLTVSHPVRGATTLEALGVAAGLATYRPFLPYNELGAIADEKPSALHDTLEEVLGLEAATQAADRLRRARLDRERAWKDVRADAKQLAARLQDVDDDRAARVVVQLEKASPNLDAIEAAVGVDAGGSDPGLTLLRQLAQLVAPNVELAQQHASELGEAARELASFAGTDVAEKARLADLLEAALEHHEHHGVETCPVCGEGRLDDTWAASTRRSVADLRAAARRVEAARTRLLEARRRALGHVVGAPDALRNAASVDIDTAGLLHAYEQLELVRRIDDDAALAQALTDRLENVAAGIANVAEQAARKAREREDVWRPHVGAVLEWLGQARPAATGQAQVADLKAAEKALKDVTADLRAERWQPIAELAKHHWETLRHQSNVEISDVVLTGSATKRHVAIDVKIDGVDGAALGVMSQGELHALALALFLPRATMEESPFRFVLIDDPVQSMDPARVDGLARVLEEVAATRQVVVFTHDDRLTEAVRRLQIEATVLEVARGARSRVEVRRALTPARRYLDDARALALTPELPALVATRTVAGFCRLALEAAAADAARTAMHSAGVTHAEIDDRLAGAANLLPRLALAFFQDTSRAGDVYRHAKDTFSHRHATAIRVCNEGSHDGHAVDDLKALVADVQELIGRMES